MHNRLASTETARTRRKATTASVMEIGLDQSVMLVIIPILPELSTFTTLAFNAFFSVSTNTASRPGNAGLKMQSTVT